MPKIPFLNHKNFTPEMQGWFSKTVSIYTFTILICLRRTHIILIETENHLNTMLLFSNNSLT